MARCFAYRQSQQFTPVNCTTELRREPVDPGIGRHVFSQNLAVSCAWEPQHGDFRTSRIPFGHCCRPFDNAIRWLEMPSRPSYDTSSPVIFRRGDDSRSALVKHSRLRRHKTLPFEYFVRLQTFKLEIAAKLMNRPHVPSNLPDPTNNLAVGWHCLHQYYKVDQSALMALSDSARAEGREHVIRILYSA